MMMMLKPFLSSFSNVFPNKITQPITLFSSPFSDIISLRRHSLSPSFTNKIAKPLTLFNIPFSNIISICRYSISSSFISKIAKPISLFSFPFPNIISVRRYSLSSSFTNKITKPINPFSILSVRTYCLTVHYPPLPENTKDCLLFYQEIEVIGEPFVLYLLQPLQSNVNDDDILVNHRILSHHFPGDMESHVIGSSNGLVCFTDDIYHSKPIRVGNPVTGEHLQLPPNKDDYNDNEVIDTTFGFGFDCHTKKYKILRMLFDFNYNVVTQIYTVGVASPEWRNLETPPYVPPGFQSEQVFVHESFHWLIAHGSTYPLIMSFHVGREDFNLISLPRHFGSDASLIELGGYLGLTFFMFGKIEIWIMEEYGVYDSWTRLSAVPYHISGSMHIVKPIKLLNSGNLLIHATDCKADDLVCCDPVTKTFPKNLGIHKTPCQMMYEVIPHAWSFVSLMDIAGPTNR